MKSTPTCVLAIVGFLSPAAFSQSILPSAPQFGLVPVGKNTSQTFQIRNDRAEPLAIAQVMVTDDYAQNNDCPATLAGGASCAVDVTFAPTTAGPRNGELIVAGTAGSEPVRVQLLGIGVPLVIEPAFADFGNVPVGTTSAPVVIKLTNAGSPAVELESISVNETFAQTNNCGSIIQPQTTCLVSVTFQPTAIGQKSGTLHIGTKNPSFASSRPLRGSGKQP